MLKKNYNEEDCQNYLIVNAIINQDMDALKKTLEDGEIPNGRMPNGDLLLIYAVKNKLYDICDILLQYKAKVNWPSNDGYAPIHYATLMNDDVLIAILFKYKAQPDKTIANTKKTALMLAVEEQKEKAVLALLKGGANPNARDYQKDSAVIRSVFNQKNSMEICKNLIVHGGKVGQKNDLGQDAKEIAIQSGFPLEKVIKSINHH